MTRERRRLGQGIAQTEWRPRGRGDRGSLDLWCRRMPDEAETLLPVRTAGWCLRWGATQKDGGPYLRNFVGRLVIKGSFEPSAQEVTR